LAAHLGGLRDVEERILDGVGEYVIFKIGNGISRLKPKSRTY
jgi:hypothetical protein